MYAIRSYYDVGHHKVGQAVLKDRHKLPARVQPLADADARLDLFLDLLERLPAFNRISSIVNLRSFYFFYL